MTSRLQNPSASWNTGVDHLNNLSQFPTVAASAKPSGPKTHCQSDVSCALFPVNVRSTQPLLLSASTEKRFNDQISKAGKMNHWDDRITKITEYRTQDRSGVVTLRREKKK